MPTVNLTSKYLEDAQGNKYAPVTVPSAVRWANGDDLDDKLAAKQAVIDSSNKLPASNVSGLATVATSGSYSDLSNKPTLGTAAAKDVPSSGNASTTQVVMGDDTRLTDSRNAADVYSWAKAATKPSYSYSEISNTPNIGLPVGSGTVTSLASLPVTNRMIVATISANQSSVSISNGVSALTAGCELHVVVKATADVTITLPTSSPYVLCSKDDALSLSNGDIAEINFISDGTNIYVRAIS